MSRVGGKTQAKALRDAAETLRLDYAQFLELEIFTRFGGVTDAQVKDRIARGRRIRAVLAQPQLRPLRLAEVALITALQSGALDRVPLERIGEFRSELPAWLDRSMAATVDQIERTGQLDDVVEVDVAFSHTSPGSGAQVDRHSLLPVDLALFPRQVRNHKPLTTLAPAVLLERLAVEYVYAQLCDAAMHAFAAENEARMMAMAATRTHIDSRLSRLSQREHQLRQEEITTEIVELAAGAEALSGRQRGT